MNKRGDWTNVVLVLLVIFFITSMTSLFVFQNYANNRKQTTYNDACKKIDLKEFDEFNSLDVCRDSEGNLHFVEMDCPGFNEKWGWYPKKCYAKKIKVGEVWGTS